MEHRSLVPTPTVSDAVGLGGARASVVPSKFPGATDAADGAVFEDHCSKPYYSYTHSLLLGAGVVGGTLAAQSEGNQQKTHQN